jgi:3-isopropylmalate dehydratase large subunit
MGMTITEKIIAAHAGLPSVSPGEIHDVPVDLLYIHDNNGPIAVQQFERIPDAKVWDPGKIRFVLDHHSPATTFRAAEHHRAIRAFAKKHGIPVFDVGRGVSHPVIVEEGLARPGQVVVGTDSHTVGVGVLGCLATGIGSTEAAAVMYSGTIWLMVPETIKIELTGVLPRGVSSRDVALLLLSHFGPSFLNYMAVEFQGDLLGRMSLDERMAITTMCLEMGVKNALMPAEGVPTADADADYSSSMVFDVSELVPMVAAPALPTNGAGVGETEGIEIQQATLGSCAGAYYHDLAAAAEILKGKRVAPGVRFVIVPNTARIVERAAETGVLSTLLEAGAVVSSPACGTCAGYEVGCLAPAETCISTTTRNMDGRMGPDGRIYLASAATVAASALRGVITDPRRL